MQLRRKPYVRRARVFVSVVDFAGAHRILTAAAGMAGETEIAGAALRDCAAFSPNLACLGGESHMLVRPRRA